MSFDFNYKYWVNTKNHIKDLIRRQNVLKKVEPTADPIVIFDILSQMFILYVELVSKLCYCYRQTFQVQKKNALRNLIEPSIQRLMELKNKLKKLEFRDFIYLDKSIIARKLTPYDLLIWNFENFTYRRPSEIQTMLWKYQNVGDEEQKKKIAMKHATTLIQSHERARQARSYKGQFEYNPNNLKVKVDRKTAYNFNHKDNQLPLVPVKRTIFNINFIKPINKCWNMLETKFFKEIVNESSENNSVKQLENSAVIIQRSWKNYRTRKIDKINKNIKEILYGLRKSKKLCIPEKHNKITIKTYQNNLKQKTFDNRYLKFMNEERIRLLEEYKPHIIEDISDHIRGWFKEFYDQTGDFHPYPNDLNYGTISLLLDETMDIDEFKEYLRVQGLSKEEKKALKEKQKLLEKKEKEKLKKEKLKEQKRQKKMKDAGVCDIGSELANNKNVERIEEFCSQLLTDWKYVDEYLNKQQDIIKEWITQNELSIIHKELRNYVDEYMRLEWDLLKKAWSVDTKKIYKSEKPKKQKVNNTKVKIIKDLTADRTIESIYEELKNTGIIEDCNVKYFHDYLGDFNVMADELRNENFVSTLPPSKADIRMVIQDIMFGMGTFNVDKPKSVCLIGPHNSGKNLLCKIIATELGATFMNLSPERTCQFSDNLNYFIHIIMKAAKAFEPTIIYVQEAHRIFWKKVPKDQMDIKPTLLKGVLVKNILKSIKNNDKIMLVGTSSEPWSAIPIFKKVFQNIFLIPESDYGSIFLLWLELITNNVSDYYFEDFIFSVLARVFQKYNTGDITDNFTNCLSIQRRMRLHINSIDINEFLDELISRPIPIFPPDEKEAAKYSNYYNSLQKFGKPKTQTKKESEKK